ncbi:hydrogenase expression/formation protein HypE [Pseudofrankia sp. DC12]|uniref:HypE family hydrogenase expression/formation protein n=1 Tax=Pseudofrankia sp. DC12 TaxID=683315 RepID=UPI0005F7F88F|nr:hydrogenase expression/formation protein HypE [Pseudofrankia sp. DC12]
MTQLDEATRERRVLDRVETARRRRPKLRDEHITMAHGAGGKATAALVDAVFLEAFRNPALEALDDGARVDAGSARLVVTTDSYVVTPLFFPGGCIGDLAVNGTVNDLAVCGAKPLYLTCGFVLEEGLPTADLRRIVEAMAAAARVAGVTLVTGDTKVVPRGRADGCYVNTTGIGLLEAGGGLFGDELPMDGVVVADDPVGPWPVGYTPPGDHPDEANRVDGLGMVRARPGDVVLVSGPVGDHGVTIMLARGELDLEADLRSDTAPLAGLVEQLLAATSGSAQGGGVRAMRDATRGGVATVLNELAMAAGVGVVVDEDAVPVREAVRGAAELLGIDPLYVACEGRLVAVVAPEAADAALAALRADPLGAGAAVIGRVVDDPPGLVLLNTAFGGTRIVGMLVGDPLPRIC